MGGLWRARRWRFLLNLIDHLPRNSAYIEALADDEELAAARAGEAIPERRERLSEWSPEKELLANIFDRLGNLMAVSIAVAGGKVPKIEPFPRPVTAMRRAKQAHADAEVRGWIESMSREEVT